MTQSVPAASARKRQLSISGSLGSGKTTIGRLLSGLLDWDYHSTGSVQRSIAQGMGISTLELNYIAEHNPDIDIQVDKVFRSLAQVQDIIVDSRMAWHFLPASFKVRLTLSAADAAGRILQDNQRDAEKYATSTIAIEDIKARTASEIRRFGNTYAVDISDIGNYDFVLDTAVLKPALIARLVHAAYFSWINQIAFPEHVLSPKILFPSGAGQPVDPQAIADWVAQIHGSGFPLTGLPRVLFHQSQHVILDHHELVCAALRCGLDFIPVQLVSGATVPEAGGLAASEYVRANVSAAAIARWETACGFSFANAPSWLADQSALMRMQP